MKNRFLILILLLLPIIIATVGCTDQGSARRSDLLTVNSINEIDAMLETSPVFIEMGAGWCPSCVEQKPIVEEVAAEYEDRVKFIYIDTDKQRELGNHFNVYNIPDLFMIVRSDNGRYIYITRYGTLTYDRQEAMMLGVTPKEVLEITIQDGLRLREQNFR